MKTQNLSWTKTNYVLIVVLAFFLFSGCQQKKAANEIDEEQKAKEELMIELCYTCLNIYSSGNLALVEEVYSPELIAHRPDGDGVGLDAYRENIKKIRTALPDLSFNVDEIFVKDDKVVYRFTLNGTHTGVFVTPLGEIPPTGNKIKLDLMEIDRIIDGKIVEEWIFYDNLEFMSQLGFTLTPPENPGE